MKILYLITQADRGGAQKYTLALAKHFKGAIASGHATLRNEPSGSDSKSIDTQTLFDDAKKIEITTFPIKHLKRNLNPWHDILAIGEIRQLIKNYNPDILHLNSSKAGILGSFASIGLKTKTIFTAHGFVFNEPMSLIKKIFYIIAEKLASHFRDYIICVSNADKHSAQKYRLISPHQISTIYNGIEPINFLPKSEAQSFLKLPANKLIIGTIAGFYKTKGLDTLMQAMALMPNEIKSKMQIVLIGNGPEFKNLKLKIKNLKLEGIVLTPGSIDNASVYLKAFDIFILPSRKEGFPYTLLEAMQAGLPIITTKVGGIPEAVDNAGILVEANQPPALAEALKYLINNPNEQLKLANLAEQRAQNFSQTQMLTETQKIYSQLTTTAP